MFQLQDLDISKLDLLLLLLKDIDGVFDLLSYSCDLSVDFCGDVFDFGLGQVEILVPQLQAQEGLMPIFLADLPQALDKAEVEQLLPLRLGDDVFSADLLDGIFTFFNSGEDSPDEPLFLSVLFPHSFDSKLLLRFLLESDLFDQGQLFLDLGPHIEFLVLVLILLIRRWKLLGQKSLNSVLLGPAQLLLLFLSN